MGGLPSPMSHISLLADLGIKAQFSKPWSILKLPGPLMGFPECPWLLQCLSHCSTSRNWRKPVLGQGSHTSVQGHTENQLLDTVFLQENFSLFPWVFCMNLLCIFRYVSCNTSLVSVYIHSEPQAEGGFMRTSLLHPLVQRKQRHLAKGCLTPCTPFL